MKQVWLDSEKFYFSETHKVRYADIMELMAAPSESICQYLVPQHCFFEYVSRVYQDVCERQLKQRTFVLSFKEGKQKYVNNAAAKVARYIKQIGMNGNSFYFVCVPASSPKAMQDRFERFCNLVAMSADVSNGYDLVKVVSKRAEVKLGGARSTKNYVIDENVKGKKIILFDDVRTSGKSFARFAYELEKKGANVVQGIFLAQDGLPLK